MTVSPRHTQVKCKQPFLRNFRIYVFTKVKQTNKHTDRCVVGETHGGRRKRRWPCWGEPGPQALISFFFQITCWSRKLRLIDL